ncbi:MAG: hypothetical protein ACYDHZ_04535 [Dehalococcoidia bacterium]
MGKALLFLLAILTLAAGCVTVSAPPQASTSSSSSGQAAPAITKFEVTPSSLTPGGSATLQWEITNATTVSIDQGIGTVALSGNRSITPGSSTTYKLTATNQYGSSSASTQVLVAGAQPSAGSIFNLPYVAVFTVQPANTIADYPALLVWDVQNAFDVVIEPGLSIIPIKGSSQITSPRFTTTYKLTATNDQGSIIATTTQTISGVLPSIETPVINYFTANPYVIHKGDKATLSWQTVGGSAVTIDKGGLGTISGEGTAQVSPDETTTYTMIVTGPAGAQYQSVTVNVK